MKCTGGRSDKFGSLEVDGVDIVEGSSPGTMKHLTVDGPVFIGNSIAPLIQFTSAISYYTVSPKNNTLNF